MGIFVAHNSCLWYSKTKEGGGKIKILFINLPYHGHVGLTQELIKAGHHVTYLLPYD